MNLTLRGLDAVLLQRMRSIARTEHVSLDRAAIILLRRGAGLTEGQVGQGGGSHWLDRHVGTLSQQEEDDSTAAGIWVTPTANEELLPASART